MAAARSNTVLRALDGKGRLMLPLEAAAAARVPAERDSAVITVFLPGAQVYVDGLPDTCPCPGSAASLWPRI